MKKMFFFAFISMLLFACNMPDNSQDGVPFIDNGLVASNYEDLSNGDETTIFKLGSTIFFRFNVRDIDLDVKEAFLIQKSSDITLDPVSIPLGSQTQETVTYGGYIKAEYDGDWEVSLYVVDEKGNRSNTITKNIVITTEGLTIFTYTYVLNGGVGEVPVDHRKYVRYMKVHIKEADTIYKTGYEFLHWNTKPDDSGEVLEAGTDYLTDGIQDRILYAIWKCPLSNIRHTRTGDISSVTNINEFTVEWDEPNNVNFNNVLLTIKSDGVFGGAMGNVVVDNILIDKGVMSYSFSHNWFMVDWFMVGLRTVDEYGIPSSILEYRIRKE
jgi:hypothetical protein